MQYIRRIKQSSGLYSIAFLLTIREASATISYEQTTFAA